MGQKVTKAADLYVTEDTTTSRLPDEDINVFAGKQRDYLSAEVRLDEPQKEGNCV